MRGASGDGKVLVICDFDGTVSRTDVGNGLFNRFTGRGWQAIDDAYCSGEIGSREAYTRVAAILEGDRDRMLAFVLREAELDRHFPAFRQFCREKALDLIIVSDGLDFYIDAVLRRHNLGDIPVYANRTVFRAGQPPAIEFPWPARTAGDRDCKRGILRPGGIAMTGSFTSGTATRTFALPRKRTSFLPRGSSCRPAKSATGPACLLIISAK